MLFLFINIFTVYLTSEMERPKRSKQAPKRFEEFVLDGRSVEENTDFGGNGRGRNGRGGKGRGGKGLGGKGSEEVNAVRPTVVGENADLRGKGRGGNSRGGNSRGGNSRGGKGRGRIAVRPTTLNTRTTGINVHWY